jgi:glutamate dehydrogenase
MTAHSRLANPLVEALRVALTQNALPGETEGFGKDKQADAASFVAEAAAVRASGTGTVKLQSTGGEAGNRRMRLVTINEDMPFLVDSVAAAVASKGVGIHRLLHPIVGVERSKDGRMKAIGEGQPESIIYMELDRVDARRRVELVREVEHVLADVRAAVGDWRDMVDRMIADADQLSAKESECAELLRWFTHNNFTLLGHVEVGSDGRPTNPLGIFRNGIGAWNEEASVAAIKHLAKTKQSLLLLKAARLSPVHRLVPLDLVMLRLPDGKVSLHAGLWTSAALRAPAEEVPILRKRLATLDRELGFAPNSHGGKALAHAVSTLPHDLLIGFDDRPKTWR